MGNKIKFYLSEVLASLVMMATYGAVLQTFMLEYGFSEEKVNIFSSIMLIVQVVVILALSKFSDKTKNVINATAFMRIFEFPLIAVLFVLCFFTDANKSLVFVIICALGIVYNLSLGSRSVLSYKLPYNIIDMRDYGRVMSCSGILIGIFSVLFSVAISFLQRKMEYFASMKVVFAVSFALALGYIAATLLLKPTHEMPTLSKEEKTNILKYKPFTSLIIPNLARGFSTGIIGMAVTIGYYTGSIDKNSATYIVIITSTTTILGCFAFALVTKHINDGHLLIISCLAVAIFTPLMIIGNTAVFLIMYTFVYFFNTIISYALPVTVTKIIDYKIAGQYSAWRMTLHTLGTSAAGFVCIAMFRIFGVLPTMIFSGATMLVCGIGYFVYLKKYSSNGVITV